MPENEICQRVSTSVRSSDDLGFDGYRSNPVISISVPVSHNTYKINVAQKVPD